MGCVMIDGAYVGLGSVDELDVIVSAASGS